MCDSGGFAVFGRSISFNGERSTNLRPFADFGFARVAIIPNCDEQVSDQQANVVSTSIAILCGTNVRWRCWRKRVFVDIEEIQ